MFYIVFAAADNLAPLDNSRFLFQRHRERIGVGEDGHRLSLQRVVVLISPNRQLSKNKFCGVSENKKSQIYHVDGVLNEFHDLVLSNRSIILQSGQNVRLFKPLDRPSVCPGVEGVFPHKQAILSGQFYQVV